jgi:ubiquinone biosynthesis protein
LLAGISQGDGIQVAEAALRLGEVENPEIDRRSFTNKIETILGETKGSKLADLQIGGIVLLIMQACAADGVRIPAEISLIGKTLMNLDRLGITLSPQFDPREAIRRNLEALSSARLHDSFSLAGIMGSLMETKDFLAQLPRRINEITELVATNRLRVKVDSIDEHKLMLGFQKIANRITLGLLLSAFIVGSSMLARVETSFRIFGYPGLAMVFFIIAAVGAVWLMLQILVKDE